MEAEPVMSQELRQVRHELFHGFAEEVLPALPEGSVQVVVTSPPYWGLRSYLEQARRYGGDPACEHEWQEHRAMGFRPVAPERDVDPKRTKRAARNTLVSRVCVRCGAWEGELGLEPSLDWYIERLVGILDECYRVLHPQGVLWLNLGDTYATRHSSVWGAGRRGLEGDRIGFVDRVEAAQLPERSLCGVPWRVALALQQRGWILRADIIWHKPNALPGGNAGRPTVAHEYLFMFVKHKDYYYNEKAAQEPTADGRGWRNLRSVWSIPIGGSWGESSAHTAWFPAELVERCIRLASPDEGVCAQCGSPADCRCAPRRLRPAVVLDPFGGTGTVSVVAHRLGRSSVYIDASRLYWQEAQERMRRFLGEQVPSLFADEVSVEFITHDWGAKHVQDENACRG